MREIGESESEGETYALNKEKGALNQRIQMAHTSYKRQGMDSPLKVLESSLVLLKFNYAGP